MNRLEKIRAKYPGYYIRVESQLKYKRAKVKKLELSSSVDVDKESIIQYSKTLNSLETNIDKALGLLL